MFTKLPPVVAGLLLVGGTTMVAGGVMTYRAGAVRVAVDEHRPGGDHVHLLVPAVMIPPAVRLIPKKELQRHAKELQPLLPVLKIAARELARTPDFTLVEVKDKHQHVLIRKQDGALLVDVTSPDETVHLKVPLETIYSVAEELQAEHRPV